MAPLGDTRVVATALLVASQRAAGNLDESVSIVNSSGSAAEPRPPLPRHFEAGAGTGIRIAATKWWLACDLGTAVRYR
jgi:hypothetical protein